LELGVTLGKVDRIVLGKGLGNELGNKLGIALCKELDDIGDNDSDNKFDDVGDNDSDNELSSLL